MGRRFFHNLACGGLGLILVLAVLGRPGAAPAETGRFTGNIQAASLSQALGQLSAATGVAVRCRQGGERRVAEASFAGADPETVLRTLLAGQSYALVRETDETGRPAMVVWLLGEDRAEMTAAGNEEEPPPTSRAEIRVVDGPDTGSLEAAAPPARRVVQDGGAEFEHAAMGRDVRPEGVARRVAKSVPSRLLTPVVPAVPQPEVPAGEGQDLQPSTEGPDSSPVMGPAGGGLEPPPMPPGFSPDNC